MKEVFSMKRKQIFALIISITIIGGLVSGCGKPTAKPTTDTTSTQSPAKTEVSTDKKDEASSGAQTEITGDKVKEVADSNGTSSTPSSSGSSTGGSTTPSSTPTAPAATTPTASTPSPTFKPPVNPANNPAPQPSSGSTTTTVVNKPDGFDRSLADSLSEAYTQLKLSQYNNKSAFTAYVPEAKTVAGKMIAFADVEAKTKQAQDLLNYSFEQDPYTFTILEYQRIQFETDQTTTSGILAAIKSNYVDFLKARSSVGVVSIYYDSSIKKNRVVMYQGVFGYSQGKPTQ